MEAEKSNFKEALDNAFKAAERLCAWHVETDPNLRILRRESYEESIKRANYFFDLDLAPESTVSSEHAIN